MDVGDFRSNIINILDLDYNTTVKDATKEELYNAIAKAVIRSIKEKKDNPTKNIPLSSSVSNNDANEKTVCLISKEYTIGNPMYSNLFSTGLYGQYAELLTENGIDTEIFEYENDLGYGFTKEGFIAGGIMESATTKGLDIYGYGLRYKYGYYKQCIDDGKVTEKIDRWSTPSEPWSKRVEKEKIRVDFKGQSVYAVPYDTYMVGQGARKINTMRFWQAEAIEEFDTNLFYGKKHEKAFRQKEQAELLTLIFIGNDEQSNMETLKLQQEYFLVSASIQDIVRKYKEKGYTDFTKFVSDYAITLSSDGCIIAIPELLRVLVENEGMTANKALKIVKEAFSYISFNEISRNIDYKLLKSIAPGLCKYISVIQKDYIKRKVTTSTKETNDGYILDEENIHTFGIVEYICNNDKVKNDFKEVTQREWLYLINKELSFFLTDKIGNMWITSMERIKELSRYLEDEVAIKEFEDIKMVKKRQLADYIYQKEKIQINKEFIFRCVTKDCKKSLEQVKQISNDLRAGVIKDYKPTVYLFRLKPQPYDTQGKDLIKEIVQVASMINNDESLQSLLKIVFLQNYNVSYEKKVIPAVDVVDNNTDIRFMLNGAVYKTIEDNDINDTLTLRKESLKNIIETGELSVDSVVDKFCENVWKISNK